MTYPDERAEFDRDCDAEFLEAVEDCDLTLREMGGNCTAYVRELVEGERDIIQSTEWELTAPTTLEEPVTVFHEVETEDGAELTEPVTFPTFRAYLVDLYGPMAGPDRPSWAQED